MEANRNMMASAYSDAVNCGADVVVLSELTMTGYPPEDLLLKTSFIRDANSMLHFFASVVEEVPAVVGFPEPSGLSGPISLYNSAALCRNGKVESVYRKHLLPNYSVFDERRYFMPGSDIVVSDIAGVRCAIAICEDIWGNPTTADAGISEEGAPPVTEDDGSPVAQMAAAGAQIVLSLNASPYRRSKQRDRETLVAARARQVEVPIVYVNQAGAQDDLIFDGSSFVVDRAGTMLCRLKPFESHIAVVDVPIGTDASAPTGPMEPHMGPEEEVWNALVVATRDYVRKNRFTDVVIGLSGGVDSSAVAAICVDALGSDRVHGVSMPSRYSSGHSVSDADGLAENLGIDIASIPIEEVHRSMASSLAPTVGKLEGLTDQNVQSRIRGMILMALSNDNGWLVMNTGNKTESSVGYTTLYGDAIGAYAPIGDVPKLTVYDLCHWRNKKARAQGKKQPIPENCLSKPPSAELGPGQFDTDSLPPYAILDRLVEAYVDADMGSDKVIGLAQSIGSDKKTALKVMRLVDSAEYKRRQSPMPARITAKSFGRDRRIPVTNLY